MKTTFKLIGAVATVAALFSSCKKEAFNEEVKPETVEMTIIAGADDSKTVLGDGGAVTWSSTGETLQVLENNGEENLSSYTSGEGVSTDGGKTMSFAVTLDSKTADSFDYYALYPSKSYVSGTYSDAKKVKVSLQAAQCPTETSFDPTSDILVSRPMLSQTEQPTSLELQFARIVAIGKMAIKNLNSEENVQKVTFTAIGKVVNGRSYINLEDASAFQYGYYGASATVTMDYSAQSIAANGMTAYFTCWPFELAAGDTFSVEVETENYTFTKDVTLADAQSLAFNVGKASAFSVNFAGIEGVKKEASVQLVPDGEYVIAYDKYMMTVGTTSNKYRDVAALPKTLNADGSYSVDVSAAWNFVYDSETDSYLINSVSDNTLYLQGSSSASDFNLKEKADATSFTITKNEETGTYRIANTRCIGYNPNNGNPRFAMYLTTATAQYVDLNLYPAKVVELAEITVQETLSLSADLAEGEISVSWKNVDMSCVAVDVYQDEECTTKEESWIYVEFNNAKTAIVYTVDSNDTETARTAYIKVEAISTDGESEDSKIIVVTQAAASTGEEKSYSIVFKTASSDGTTSITESTAVSTVVSEGIDYIASFTSSCSSVYYNGVKGVKLGSNKYVGTLEFNLADEVKNNVISIVVETAQYGSDTGTITMYNGTDKLKEGISPADGYTHTFSSPTTVESLKFVTSTKRAYISKITIKVNAN